MNDGSLPTIMVALGAVLPRMEELEEWVVRTAVEVEAGQQRGGVLDLVAGGLLGFSIGIG